MNGQFYDSKYSLRATIEAGYLESEMLGVALNGLAMAYWMQKKQLYNETKEFLSHQKETDKALIDSEFGQVTNLLIESVIALESKSEPQSVVEAVSTKVGSELVIPQGKVFELKKVLQEVAAGNKCRLVG